MWANDSKDLNLYMAYLQELGSYSGGRSGYLKRLVECGDEEEGRIQGSFVNRVAFSAKDTEKRGRR